MITNWTPTATLATLRKRAEILGKIRLFFTERGVLEIETPLLSHSTVTAPYLQSFVTNYYTDGNDTGFFFLQTSPEYAMKRLLAVQPVPIYQLGKAFRNYGEVGRYHNPEFTLLEWYQPNFTHHQLMQEVEQLLREILNITRVNYFSYAELFAKFININPHTISEDELYTIAQNQGIITIDKNLQKDDMLHLLLTHIIEPQFTQNTITFIYDFPVSQAALARICPTTPPVAERFEVYVGSIELANGFHELTDAIEQRKRFEHDLEIRQKLNYFCPPLDEYLLAALSHGMPNCAGAALGVDRLVMLATGCNSIAEVITFPIDRA